MTGISVPFIFINESGNQTAAQLDQNFQALTAGFGQLSRFSAGVGSGAFSSTSFTTVTGWTSDYDISANFDAPNGVFTAPIAGQYRFSFAFFHDNTGTAGDRWRIRISTSPFVFSREISYLMVGTYNSVTASFCFNLAQNQAVVIQIARASGTGSFTIDNDATSTRFDGELLLAVHP